MNQLSQIADIIEEVLLEVPGQPDPRGVAEECAQKLVEASLGQLATLLGGSLTSNFAGETILNLGKIQSEPPADDDDDNFSRSKEASIEGWR